MLSPGQIADSFDRLIEQGYKDLDYHYFKDNNEAAEEWGTGSWQYKGVLYGNTIGYGLIMAGVMITQGMVDTLRLGRGLAKGTAGGWLEDGIRVLSVAGPALKLGRTALALGVARGNFLMSCGYTSNVFAMRLSGTRLFLTIRELAGAAGELAMPNSPYFGGLSQFDGLLGAIKKLGAAVELNPVTALADVERMAARGQGPVVFAIQRTGAPGHIMTAFKDLKGALKIADQAGVHPLSYVDDMLKAGATMYKDAYIVADATMVQVVEAASLAARGAQAIKEAPIGPEQGNQWILDRLLLPFHHLPGPAAVKARAQLRKAAGRPATTAKAAAVSANAGKLLAVLPPGKPTTKDAAQRASGLSPADFHNAVRELVAKGLVQTRGGAGHPLSFTDLYRLPQPARR